MCSTPTHRLYVSAWSFYTAHIGKGFSYSVLYTYDRHLTRYSSFFERWMKCDLYYQWNWAWGAQWWVNSEQYQDRTFTEVCGGVARDSRVGLRDSGRLVYSGRIGTLAHLHRVGVRVTSGSVGALGDPCTLTPLPPSCFIPFQYHSELTPPKCSWVQAWDSPYIIQIKH